MTLAGSRLRLHGCAALLGFGALSAALSAGAADPDWIHAAGPPIALDANGSGITALAFAADGLQLIVDTDRPALFVLDGASGKALRAPIASYRDESGLSAPAGDGTRVFVATWAGPRGGKLAAIDAETKSARAIVSLSREPQLMAASADGGRVALAYVDDTVQVFDTKTGHSLFGPAKTVTTKPVMGVSLDHVKAIALSPDGARLAVGVEEAPVHLFDAATGKRRLDLDIGAYQGVTFVHGAALVIAFSRDGGRIVTFEQGGNLAIHDAATGKPLGSLVQTRGRLTALALGADGKTAFSGDAEGHLQRWQLEVR